MFWLFFFWSFFEAILNVPQGQEPCLLFMTGVPPGVACCLAHSELSGRDGTGSLALIRDDQVGPYPAHLIFLQFNL